MDKNVKILVCCHKKDIMAMEEPYMPIHVGKALTDVDLGIQGDNTGINISTKNRSYSELTGMYWAWKNLKDVDIIGLCHYRRYFDFHKQYKWYLPEEAFPTSYFNSLDLSIPTRVLKTLSAGKAIVAKRQSFLMDNYSFYCYYHTPEDMKILKDVFIETQSLKMQKAFYKVMLMSNTLMTANMFIMTWHDFEEYCTWLFDVLGEVEKRIDISYYDSYQMRVYGFMAERLFNIWLYAKHIRLQYRPVMLITDEGRNNPSALDYLQLRLAGWLKVKITNPGMQDLKR